MKTVAKYEHLHIYHTQYIFFLYFKELTAHFKQLFTGELMK